MTFASTINEGMLDTFVSAYHQELVDRLERDPDFVVLGDSPDIVSHVAWFADNLVRGHITIDSIVKRACLRLMIKPTHVAINAFVRATPLEEPK